MTAEAVDIPALTTPSKKRVTPLRALTLATREGTNPPWQLKNPAVPLDTPHDLRLVRASCGAGSEQVPGVETARVNYARRDRPCDPLGARRAAHLIGAVEKAGYGAAPAAATPPGARERHARRTSHPLLVFSALAVPTIISQWSMDIAGMHINDDPRLHV